jgi:hypothetical protein
VTTTGNTATAFPTRRPPPCPPKPITSSPLPRSPRPLVRSPIELPLQRAEQLHAELPSVEVALAAGRALIATVTEWKRGKAFSHGVQSYSKAKGAGDGAGWHSRVSTHQPKEATFDEFWRYLGEEHATYEKECVCCVSLSALRLSDIKVHQGGQESNAHQGCWAESGHLVDVLRVPDNRCVPARLHHPPDWPSRGGEREANGVRGGPRSDFVCASKSSDHTSLDCLYRFLLTFLANPSSPKWREMA